MLIKRTLILQSSLSFFNRSPYYLNPSTAVGVCINIFHSRVVKTVGRAKGQIKSYSERLNYLKRAAALV